jgi:hypothetical protein
MRNLHEYAKILNRIAFTSELQPIRRNQELSNPQSKSAPIQQVNGRIKSRTSRAGSGTDHTQKYLRFFPQFRRTPPEEINPLGNLNPSNNKYPETTNQAHKSELEKKGSVHDPSKN